VKKRTHYHIARLAVENQNNAITEKSLTKWAFYLGTILPDLSVTQFIHPHYYAKSSDYVFNRLCRIADKPVKGISDAIVLGEMVHYLCDFCCFAHIGGRLGKVSEHLLYERQIHRYLLDNYQSYQSFDSNRNSYHLSGEILEQIKDGLTAYTAMEPSCDWDIRNSIQMSALIYNGLLISEENKNPVMELQMCKDGLR
jgi:hypothetical protein